MRSWELKVWVCQRRGKNVIIFFSNIMYCIKHYIWRKLTSTSFNKFLFIYQFYNRWIIIWTTCIKKNKNTFTVSAILSCFKLIPLWNHILRVLLRAGTKIFNISMKTDVRRSCRKLKKLPCGPQLLESHRILFSTCLSVKIHAAITAFPSCYRYKQIATVSFFANFTKVTGLHLPWKDLFF